MINEWKSTFPVKNNNRIKIAVFKRVTCFRSFYKFVQIFIIDFKNLY